MEQKYQKMGIRIEPIFEINQRAKQALIQELGIVDTLRFLNQFRTGSGDYTAERAEFFKGESVDSIIAEIKARRTENEAK